MQIYNHIPILQIIYQTKYMAHTAKTLKKANINMTYNTLISQKKMTFFLFFMGNHHLKTE